MILWILSDLAVLGAAVTIGVLARHSLLRFLGWLATVLAGVVAFLLELVFVFFSMNQPPTLSMLERDFATKRGDLEMIVQMVEQERGFTRIAPDFSIPGNLPESRWNEYRRRFSKAGIDLGVASDGAGDVFLMAGSIGLLNRGHATGYVHCAVAVASGYRYAPCRVRGWSGRQEYDPKTRTGAYSFRKLDEEWYVYDQGPS